MWNQIAQEQSIFVLRAMRQAVQDQRNVIAAEKASRARRKLTSDYDLGWLRTFQFATVVAAFMVAMAFLGLHRETYATEKAALRYFIIGRRDGVRGASRRFDGSWRYASVRARGAVMAWENWLMLIRNPKVVYGVQENRFLNEFATV